MNPSSLENTILFNELLEDANDVFDSSSEDEVEENVYKLASLCYFQLHPIKNKRNTIKNYCEEVVESYTPLAFSSHFRVTKFLFQNLSKKFLESEIYQKLISSAYSRANINAEKHILIFLWFAGHQTCCFRDLADRFDVSLSSLHDVITRVMMFLSSMTTEVIKFPSDEEKAKTKLFYTTNKLFPNVVGSIDGCHIRIDRPSDRPTDYFNRKDYHSIILQGVCNEQLKFLDVCIGFPGSVHDLRIFRSSSLFTKLSELCSGEEHILGDSAYPLLTNLITLKLKGPERICHFIRACCVLHNLSINDKLSFEPEDILDDEPELFICQETPINDASKIRNDICKNLLLPVCQTKSM